MIDNLPHSKDTEEHLLGIVFQDDSTFSEIAHLEPKDFYNPITRSAYEAMHELVSEGQPINPVTVMNKMSVPVAVSEIVRWFSGLPVLMQAEPLIAILRDKRAKRDIIHKAHKLLRKASDDIASGDEIINEAIDSFQEVKGNVSHKPTVSLFETTPTSIERWDKMLSKEIVTIQTGIPDVDRELTGGGLEKGMFHVLGARPGSGKALALDTPIPTPDGWTTMGDIKVGDKVFDEKGNICNVINATDVMYGRPCYSVKFSDGTEIIADAEHQWFTNTRTAKKSAYGAKRYRDENGNCKLYGWDQSDRRTFPCLATTEKIKETLTVGSDNRFNHSVAVAAPINLPEVDLPVPPYVLGAWLGDGVSENGAIASADMEIIRHIVKSGFTVTVRTAKYMFGILDLHVKLKSLNVSRNKHIPPIYLRASLQQRLELMQGLMDTDGHVATDGGCEFMTTKLELAHGFYELAMSLGIKTRMKIGRATLNGRYIGKKYRFVFKTDLPVCRLTRKLDRLKSIADSRVRQRFVTAVDPVQSVPVRCIEVDSPSHLFLVSKSFIATHNSSLGLDILAHNALNGKVSVFFTLELSEKVLIDRLLSPLAGVERYKITSQYINEYDKRRLVAVAENLKDIPLYVNAKARTVADMRIALRDVQRKAGKIDLVIVDFIQRMTRGKGSAYEGVTNNTIELADLASEYECAVLALSQFSRESTKKDRPGLVDFRDSGAIEELGRTIFALWADESNKVVRPVNFACLKQGEGKTFDLPLAFNVDFMTFGPRRCLIQSQ